MSFKKGTFYLFLAWGFWVINAYLINAWLTRQFTTETIGNYGTVISVLWWIQIFVINGIPYALQRFMPGNEKQSVGLFRTGFRLQIAVGVVLLVITFFASSFFANLFNSPHLLWYFRFAFLDIPLLGIFHLLVAYQNGLRRFGRQAILYIVYALSRLGFVILIVTLMDSIIGAYLANAAGSLVGILLGLSLLGRGKPSDSFPAVKLVRFAFPSLLYFLMLNLFFYVDFWTVTYYLNDEASGFYYLASLIGRVPFFIFLGLTATLLPILSGALHENRIQSVQETIKTSIRILLLFSAPVLVFLTLFSQESVAFVYTAQNAQAGDILQILIWAMTFLTLLSILTTIINADNRPVSSFIITGTCIGLDIGLCLYLVPKFGVTGGAAATSIAVFAGCVAGIIWVYRRFKALVDKTSTLRILAAMAVMAAVSLLLRAVDLHFILIGFSGAAAYLVILVVTGELNLKAMQAFRKK